ncbi:MAG: cyclic pyranopterin monophosphate synthase MoaC [Hyphomonadaceae bacterium]|nr:cyclic pyranopterin monophosphate synthase MoaC [Hyphomonadaceae bacterium]
MAEGKLTHLDAAGRPQMVDVSAKAVSSRTALAEGRVLMSAEALELALGGATKKGDAITTSVLAGIMGAKRTADLIPLCHPLPINKVNVDISPCEGGLRVVAEVRTSGKTGVEMEALTAVSTACLTLYDMLKAVQKDMVIGPIRLLEKTGGKSADYLASEPEVAP